jgi:secernin
MVELLEDHGQGGPCEEGGDWSYHNSFMVADAQEAWVMETAGKWWVAERVTAGELTGGVINHLGF